MIQVLAYCPPALLASASFDGSIFVWNMTSAAVTAKLVTPNARWLAPGTTTITIATQPTVAAGDSSSAFGNAALDGMLAQVTVNSLCFLPGRVGVFDGAALVAGGGGARVWFWNIYRGYLLGGFCAGDDHSVAITSMAVVEDGRQLITGDSQGA